MITGIAFVGIVTQNPEMRAFCRDVLGLQVLAENPDRFTYFATDRNGRLELLAPHTNTAQHQHPHRISQRIASDFDISTIVRGFLQQLNKTFKIVES